MTNRDQIQPYHLQAMPLPRKPGITDACLINNQGIHYQQKFICWGNLPEHLVTDFIEAVNAFNPTYGWSDAQRLIKILSLLKENYPFKWH